MTIAIERPSAPEITPASTLAAYAAHQGEDLAGRFRLAGGGGVEEHAYGSVVTMSRGRDVLDMGSYAVPLLGHRPDAVVAAVVDALGAVPTSTRLLPNPTVGAYLDAIVSSVGDPRLTHAFLGLNGTDAVEAALKMAVAATGVPSVLAVERGYHGKSTLALAATWDPARKTRLAGVLPHSRHIPIRADAVARALDEAPAAALIVEPVQGEGGGRRIPPEILRRWCDDAHARGCLVIADEIQCGFHRCGPLSVAVDDGVEVDAVLLGKALGGGVMPLSAVVATERLWDPLHADPYFHTATFASHPLSCAAGLAALRAVDEARGQLAASSDRLATMIAAAGDAGGDTITRAEAHGLLGVLEFASPATAGAVMLRCARQGLLLAPSLTWPAVLRALPPCTVTDEQWATATGVLVSVVRAVTGRAA